MNIEEKNQREISEIRCYIESKIKAEKSQIKNISSINDLLSVDDDEFFLKLCYKNILGREADLLGLHNFLENLSKGIFTREDIILNLHLSEEGVNYSVSLAGFKKYIKRVGMKKKIIKVPVLGKVFSFYLALRRILRLSEKIENEIRGTKVRLSGVEKRSLDTLEFLYSLKYGLSKSNNNINITQGVSNNIHEVRGNNNERPIHSDELLKKFINDFYIELSERFRGSEIDIFNRNKIYADIFLKLLADNKRAPILDIACGRGEMLQVISDINLNGIGIDTNDDLIEYCQSKKLNVTKGDALEFLQSLNEESLGAVTTTHFVEHLEFEYLVKVLRESFRTLKPGGGIIVETPNPLNLVVSTVQFYMDPSHRNPIPMNLMQLLLEKIGFEVTEIDLSSRGLDENLGTVEHPQLNCLLNSPQDYALLGIKPE